MKKIIALPDLHAPEHDEAAFSLALKVIKEVRPDQVVILGDFGNMGSISRFVKKLDKTRFLQEEVKEVKKCLARVKAACPNYMYLLGNHEARAEKYIAERAPELFGLVSLPQILEIPHTNWRPYQEIYTVGKMSFVHDLGFHGASAVQRTAQAAGRNLIIGHLHSAQVHYTGTLDGERHVTISSGWLGAIDQIDYCSPAATQHWQHGVTLVNYDNGGNAHAQFLPFVNKSCIVNEKVIKL